MDARLICVAALVLLAGCGAQPVHVPPTTAELCAPWKPIMVSRQDVLTDGTARQILDHDATGAKLGCWPQPSTKEK